MEMVEQYVDALKWEQAISWLIKHIELIIHHVNWLNLFISLNAN